MNDELTLNDVMKAKEAMDNQPVPTVGRSFWEPETEELVYLAPVKHFSLEDLKKIFPIK